MNVTSTIAIVAYEGVLADETEAFRFVLSRLPGARVITVGDRPGAVGGPGGAQLIEAGLHEIGQPEVIAVPGGLGCHRQVGIAAWLRTVEPRWLLASSTGSALLATAGLLRDATAATHWLAGSILERHGAHPSPDRLVVAGPIVTCTGRASAYDAALVVARSYGGADLVQRILAELAAIREELERPPSRRSSWRRRRRSCPPRALRPPDPSELLIMVELEETGAATHRR